PGSARASSSRRARARPFPGWTAWRSPPGWPAPWGCAPRWARRGPGAGGSSSRPRSRSESMPSPPCSPRPGAPRSPRPGSGSCSTLVIRDVTESRLAEQTIRSLFQFLQDRDEDRTSLLLRTNAAIEAERNRIARDLHDGPIQGVTGATLSLEAVRLMVEAGDQQGAAEMLKQVQEELAEEADSLRRVMSDLRPPVLEE